MISEKILISIKREIRLQRAIFFKKQVAFFTSEGANLFIHPSVQHFIFCRSIKTSPPHIPTILYKTGLENGKNKFKERILKITEFQKFCTDFKHIKVPPKPASAA
jgi:hypothetical protein